MARHLPPKCEALDLIHSTTEKSKHKKERKRERERRNKWLDPDEFKTSLGRE